MHTEIKCDLEYRTIQRGEDCDYFIETFSVPVNLIENSEYLSRIQFPKSRAILVRTSPLQKNVTIHIMRDVDLQSSFANFEVDLSLSRMSIQKKEFGIEICILKK